MPYAYATAALEMEQNASAITISATPIIPLIT